MLGGGEREDKVLVLIKQEKTLRHMLLSDLRQPLAST